MNKSIFIGFDGYIDQILYPVSSISSSQDIEFFDTIADFGQYLISKSGKSCNLQLLVKSRQLGGNGPIFGRTLKSLGCNIKIAGMFGAESIHSAFSDIFDKDSIISFMNPMHTDALEFKDGKIMMCPMATYINDPLTLLKKASEKASYNIDSAFSSDLCAFLNWGEINFMQKLWEDIYEKYFEYSAPDKTKILFFDPADISQRDSKEVNSMLNIIKSFSDKRYTILSINENEATQMGIKLYNNTDVIFILNKLQTDFHLDELVIHSNYKTISSVLGKFNELPTNHVEIPLISTGAGDNFNAGYCYGKLMEMSPIECIRTAHKVSAFYITNARPAKKEDI